MQAGGPVVGLLSPVSVQRGPSAFASSMMGDASAAKVITNTAGQVLSSVINSD
jgi:hypothetical protein